MNEPTETEIKTNASSDVINTSSNSNPSSETRAIPPTSDKSENEKIKNKVDPLEERLIEAYKKLIGFEKADQPKEAVPNDHKTNVDNCINEISQALTICIDSRNISLNANIMDKLSRISRQNSIEITLIMAQMYIELMNKESLFANLKKDKSSDMNILIKFINEVIHMNNSIKETLFGEKYESVLVIFITKIIKDYQFDDDQLQIMMDILNERIDKKKQNKLDTTSFEDLIKSLKENLKKQNNLYSQYKLIFDNIDDIYGLMYGGNTVNNQSNLEYFHDFGKILLRLLFNHQCTLYLNNNVEEEEDHNKKGEIHTLFDGYEDNSHGNINVIDGGKYYIDYDKECDLMKEKLCDFVIKYVDKYKYITNIFGFQYLFYVLLKRVYLFYDEKFKNDVEPLLAEILINICILNPENEQEKVNEVKYLINKILKSDEEKDKIFKEALQKLVEKNKFNKDFSIELNDHKMNYDILLNEPIYLLEEDLNIAYLSHKQIEAGDTFTFYVKSNEEFNITHLSLILENYDIKLKITNMTEQKIILNDKKIKSSETPYKIVMLNLKPCILKIDVDNSYSWVRKKIIDYKVNVFYPQEKYILENNINLSKYHESINNTRQISGYHQSNGDKVVRVSGGEYEVNYNITEFKQNIEIVNMMLKTDYLQILNVYIDKTNNAFYVKNKENVLEKNELNEENFMKYINENPNKKMKNGPTIADIYVINGDKNMKIDENELNLKNILGFIPDIKIPQTADEGCVMYVLQYLQKAELLYFICNKAENAEGISVLINYNKYSGYQFCLSVNGEFVCEVEKFKDVNKDEGLEKNVKIFSDVLKEYGQNNKINVIVVESFDTDEKEITAEKIEEELKKNLDIKENQESNFNLIKLNQEYINEFLENSHLLKLVE